MNVDEALATGYLSPSTDSLWRWSGDGEVLTWADGTTIAFRAEAEAVLQRLAPRGLPPFGSVVMLLAACRDGWETSSGRSSFLRYANVFGQWRSGAESTSAPLHVSQIVFQRVAKGIQQVVDGLDRVGRLPQDLRQGKDAKSVLAETVFEAGPRRLSPREAEMVMRALADGVSAERLTLRFSSTEALREFADDADALRPGLPLVDENKLALRQRTGLDELPAPADLDDLSPSERVRRLIADLRRDKDLAGLARLAQDLMAAVHVPRALRQPDELPLGGVSDLSNRGPLDRLLVSELANDELTLAVRVAVNEALYLRRESPPRQPPNRRAILLDVGLRMWGVPRLFGTAVALALAATADKGAQVLAFRATPAGVEPIDLTTRTGLVAALEALETAPHPGAALRPFLAALGPGAAARTDAMLVTHPDALADRAFNNALRALDDPSMYAAAVDRDGSFRLLSIRAAGRTPVREATLSLEKLLTPPPAAAPGYGLRPRQPGTPLVVGEGDDSLPAILFTDPFPLRLPHVADAKYARASRRHGLVAATKDGRLLHWDRAGAHARQITALLPGPKPRGIWIDEESGIVRLAFVYPRDSKLRLITADLATCRTTHATLPLRKSDPAVLCARAGVLYAISRERVEAFDLETAAPAGDSAISRGVTWRRDRFFADGRTKWFALAHDGHAPVMEPVPLKVPAGQVLTLFDREGHDGPWAVLKDGRILDGAGTESRLRFPRLPVSWQLAGISADGSRIVLRAFDNKLLLDLEDAEPARSDTRSHSRSPKPARPVNAARCYREAVALAKWRGDVVHAPRSRRRESNRRVLHSRRNARDLARGAVRLERADDGPAPLRRPHVPPRPHASRRPRRVGRRRGFAPRGATPVRACRAGPAARTIRVGKSPPSASPATPRRAAPAPPDQQIRREAPAVTAVAFPICCWRRSWRRRTTPRRNAPCLRRRCWARWRAATPTRRPAPSRPTRHAWSAAPRSGFLLPSPAQQRLLVFPLGVASSPTASAFPTSDAFADQVIASTPPWTPRQEILGACMDEAGTVWFNLRGTGPVLAGYRSNGSLFSSHELDYSWYGRLIAARSQHVFIAEGNMLLHVSPTRETRTEKLPRNVRQLAVSAPFTRVRLALAYDEGGAVFWDDGDSRPFGEGLIEPTVTFARGGALVALSKGIGRAYRTEDKQVKHHATFTSPEEPPLAVVPTQIAHHFAMFSLKGAVRVYQLTG